MKKTLLFLLNLIFIIQIVHSQPAVKFLWKTDTMYSGPESVVYDIKRNFIYVSNFGKFVQPGGFYGTQTISKANLKGEIIKYDFVTNITNPTGICIHNDKLYIVERFGIVEFDLEKEKVSNRFKIHGLSFINDVATDPDGNIYVSDSDSNFVYKISNNKAEKIIQSEELANQNGILYDNGKIVIGVLSDNYVKTIDLETKEISKLAYVGPGTIDGIKKCKGGYLVSIYQGELWFVGENGETKTLINTRDEGKFIADFEYIPRKNMVIIPSLQNNWVMAYEVTLE